MVPGARGRTDPPRNEAQGAEPFGRDTSRILKKLALADLLFCYKTLRM